MNKLPMALSILGLGAATSFAEIKLTDNLSTSGFLDMSILGAAPETGDATLGGSLDQYELDFMYKFGAVSARADLNGVPADTTLPGYVKLEQAFVSYSDSASGLTYSAGRFLSSSGFEAAEPTGMYQYSWSKTLVYGGYQNGVSLNYNGGMFGVYGAVVSDLWATNETEMLNTPGFEGQISLMPMEGVTAKVAYLYQMYDKNAAATLGDESQSLLNAWAQYAVGKITAAAEFNLLTDWTVAGKGNDLSGMGYLVMGNYKVTDFVAATVRYSALTIDDKVKSTDDMDSEVTFSPSLALSSNWLALAEIKYEIDKKITNYAVESTFSF